MTPEVIQIPEKASTDVAAMAKFFNGLGLAGLSRGGNPTGLSEKVLAIAQSAVHMSRQGLDMPRYRGTILGPNTERNPHNMAVLAMDTLANKSCLIDMPGKKNVLRLGDKITNVEKLLPIVSGLHVAVTLDEKAVGNIKLDPEDVSLEQFLSKIEPTKLLRSPEFGSESIRGATQPPSVEDLRTVREKMPVVNALAQYPGVDLMRQDSQLFLRLGENRKVAVDNVQQQWSVVKAIELMKREQGLGKQVESAPEL